MLLGVMMKTKPIEAHTPITGDEGGADWWAQVWECWRHHAALELSMVLSQVITAQSPLTQWARSPSDSRGPSCWRTLCV